MPLEKWSDQVVVVHLADDPQFTDDLEALDRAVSHHPVDAVLDFGGVRFINSSNLSKLLQLRQKMSKADVRLMLCTLSNEVWGTFLLTGLDKIFEMSDSVPTALATLQIAR